MNMRITATQGVNYKGLTSVRDANVGLNDASGVVSNNTIP